MSDFSGEAEQRRLGHNGVDIIDEFCEVRHQINGSRAVQTKRDLADWLPATCRRRSQCSSRVDGFAALSD